MGGGINEDQRPYFLMPTTVDEKQFGIISTLDNNATRFVCRNFKMVNYITNLRNKKVDELMLQQEEKRKSGKSLMPRDMFGSLPSIITIEAVTTSMVTSVNVLKSWDPNGALQIEITQSNMELLLEEPPAEPAPWTPTIEQEHHNDTTLKFDIDRASVRVEFARDIDDDAKRDAVKGAAAHFIEQYCRRHNPENTMPWQQQYSEARDGPTDPFAAYRAYVPTQ